jgi:hypothetical protein
VLVAVAACSSSTPAVTTTQACADYANVGCKQYASCAPFLLKLFFGDESTCAARLNLQCPPALKASGSTLMSSGLEACVRARAAMSCTDFLSNKTPAECKLTGSLGPGTPCAAGEQCASGYCQIAVSGACGVCATRSPVGGACLSSADCEPTGLTCPAGSCVPLAALGAACNPAHPCESALYCSAGSMCMTRLGAGIACDPLSADPECDSAKGLYCDPGTALCAQAQIAPTGGACSLTTPITLCGSSGNCQLSDGSTMGTCEPAAADGAACDPMIGTNCLSPAACTNNVCAILDPTTCQ